MDWKTFISSVLSAVAWPSVVVVLLFILRRQLIALASRLENVKLPGGAEATFGKKLEEAREKLEAAKVQSPETSTIVSRPPAEVTNPYEEEAKKYPEAVVIKAFKEVERWLFELNSKLGRKSKSLQGTLEEALSCGLVKSDLLEEYRRIRDLRNIAVHGDGQITPGQALEYTYLCKTFINEIEVLFVERFGESAP